MSIRSEALVLAIPLDYDLFAELDVLGASFAIDIGGTSGSLHFPVLEPSGGDRAALIRPARAPAALDSVSESWGYAMLDGHRQVAVIESLLVEVEAHGEIDWEVEEFTAAGDDIDRLCSEARDWFDSFVQWLLCLTAQSLDVRNPDPKVINRASSNLVQVLLAGQTCTHPNTAKLMRPLMVDFDGGPTSERALTPALAQVAASNAGAAPPAVLELLSSARLFARRHDTRRAIVDAATAAESALVSLIGPSAAGQTLGSLVNTCQSVEIDAGVNLVTPRNDAVHRGISPPYRIVERAIEIVENLVLQVESRAVAVTSLRHVNRPQRHDLKIIRPTDKMVELSRARQDPAEED